MPRHPIANDSSELADLQSETAILPRGNAKCVFVEADLGAVIGRVEPAVKSRLREKINMRPELCVQKQRQTRIEEIVDLAVDETGRRLLEMINFEVDRAAQARANIVFKCRHGERGIKPVEQIIYVDRAHCAGEKTKAERS